MGRRCFYETFTLTELVPEGRRTRWLASKLRNKKRPNCTQMLINPAFRVNRHTGNSHIDDSYLKPCFIMQNRADSHYTVKVTGLVILKDMIAVLHYIFSV